MSRFRSFCGFIILAVGMISCSAPQIVTVAPTAPTVQIPAPVTPTTPTSPGAFSAITGKLAYPVGSLPAMRVAAFDVSTSQAYFVDTVQDQADFEITGLPAGSYYVVAYSLGEGGFPFGIVAGFTDGRNLIPVAIKDGQPALDIRPEDWDVRDLPPMPTTSAASSGSGSIQGTLTFMTEIIPSMAVIAFRTDSAGFEYYYTVTKEGQSSYSISLPAGEYQVAVYLLSGKVVGAYTQAVPCGSAPGCTDHSPVTVTVLENEVKEGIDVPDWAAPVDALQPYPLPTR